MSLHDTATPTLLVNDPRALVVRGVGYCRQQPDEPLQPRITRQRFDAAGRLAQSWDPRLSNPNLSTGYSLAGQPLLTDSVDAGWQLALFNEAGQPVRAWDSRGSERHTEYDPLQRPTAIAERSGEGSLQTVERMLYGDAGAALNQRGQLLRHDTPASSLSIVGYGLLGLPITQVTRVLKSLDAPHWPAELPDRDDLLDDETFVTQQTYTSLGELQGQTDAMGNLSLFTYTVAGQTKKVGLRLSGAALEWLVIDISYNASGQVEQETAGNGVITTARYAEENGRLQHLLSADGVGKRLQDLHYTYDPVGNILRLEDSAQPTRHFNNRKLEPINDYRYDSFYQLVEARGLEVVTPGYGPELPALQPTPLDPAQLRPYIQTFDYDTAGNLKERHHSNAPTFRMFTSATSNRSLAQRNDGSLPTEADIAEGLDANGNQRQLLPGQQMDWDARNQLSRVTQVAREDEPDDDEHYRYDRPGHRLRKVRMAHTPRRTLRSEVLYLPGVEIHRDGASGKEHHVISLQAGRNQVRVLHWSSAPPDGWVNDQLRYSLTDHLGSCAVELDHLGKLISQEWYYAFGGTACWVGRNGVEAKYKTVRYSGKERDATGLYYYGYRYYAPWLQRWVSTDPEGAIDSLNLYELSINNPINNADLDGRFYINQSDYIENWIRDEKKLNIEARGLSEFSPEESEIIARAIGTGISTLEESIQMAETMPQQSLGKMQEYFGLKDNFASEIGVWKSTLSLLKEYGSERGRDKFVKLSSSKNDSEAFVNKFDVHGRIFINGARISNDIDFVVTLIHEVSHIKNASGFLSVGPDTVDSWYVKGQVGKSTKSQSARENTLVNNARKSASKFVSGSLSARVFYGWDSVVRQVFTQEVQTLATFGAPIVDFASALKEFNSSPVLRSSVAGRVADQLAFAAVDLSRDYKIVQKRLGSQRTNLSSGS